MCHSHPEIRTAAVLAALEGIADETVASDLLFLEAWEMTPRPGIAASLRASQIRRANPALVEAIKAELSTRPR